MLTSGGMHCTLPAAKGSSSSGWLGLDATVAAIMIAAVLTMTGYFTKWVKGGLDAAVAGVGSPACWEV